MTTSAVEHDVNSLACFCGPTIYRLCDACGGDKCALCCRTGLRLATAAEIAYASTHDEHEPLVIVHQDVWGGLA